MKRLFTLIFSLLSISSFAQAPSVIYSAPFDEPRELEAKVLQCQNGNTLFFTFTNDNGILVDVYDSSHKKKTRATLSNETLDEGSLKNGEVCGLYNMGDSVVMFLSKLQNRTPVLYRLIISPVTGRIVNMKQIAEMGKLNMYLAASQSSTGLAPRQFFVEKDPYSNAYAVIGFNLLAHETAKRIEIIHFSGNHQEIGRSFWESESGYKYVNYMAMVVRGEEEVVVCAYAYNNAMSGGKSSDWFLSSLKKNTLTQHKLEALANYKDTRAVLTYNRRYDKLELMTLSQDKAKGSTMYYSSFVVGVNPGDYSVAYMNSLDSRHLSELRKEQYKVKDEYAGLPVGFFHSKTDGSRTIILEESSSFSTGHGSVKTLGDIGILELDEKATSSKGYVVRKQQSTEFTNGFLFLNDNHNGKVDFERLGMAVFSARPGFYSCDYVSTGNGKYVFFNDHPDNNPESNSDVRNLASISESNTVCYSLKDGAMKRFELFGSNAAQSDSRFAYLSSGDYSEYTNEYAVMMIERKGKDKKARIAWVHLN